MRHPIALAAVILLLQFVSGKAAADDAGDTNNAAPPAPVATTTLTERLVGLTAQLSDARGLTDTEKVELAAELHELTRMAPDSAPKTAALNRLSAYYSRTGDAESGLAIAEQARSLSLGLSESNELATAFYNSGLALWYLSRSEEALTEVKRAIEAHRDLDDPLEQARSYTLLGAILRSRSDYANAVDAHLQALHLSESLEDKDGVARSTNNVALIYWQLGDYQKARSGLEEVVPYYRQHGSEANLASALSNLGMIYVELQDPETALKHLFEARALSTIESNPRSVARILSNIAFAFSAMGDSVSELNFLKQSLATRETINDEWGIARSAGAIGRLYYEAKEPSLAESFYLQAMTAATNADARQELAQIGMQLSELYEEQGRTVEALELLRQSVELQTTIDNADVRERIAVLEAENEIAQRELLLTQQKKKQDALLLGSLFLAILVLGLLVFLRSRSQLLSSLQENLEKLEATATSLGESEERYRRIFDDAVVPNLLVDTDSGTILDANKPAASLCGIEKSELLGCALDNVQPEWLKQALTERQERTIERSCVSTAWSDDDGAQHHADIWHTPVSLDGRHCALITVHDSTDARLSEEQRVRNEKLESLGIFAGGIAQDFNNALVGILGRISLARLKAGDQPKVQQILAEAEQTVDQSAQLTASLAMFAKEGEPRRETLDISQTLADTATLVASDTQVDLDIRIPDGLWAADVDIVQVRQLIASLLLNGIEAMNGVGQLRLSATNYATDQSLSPTAGAGNYVRIEVSDAGMGVAPSIREKIMYPFFTTKKGQRGLGLSSAYAIATRHDGWLSFRSQAGKGTTFSIFLPAKPVFQEALNGQTSVEAVGS